MWIQKDFLGLPLYLADAKTKNGIFYRNRASSNFVKNAASIYYIRRGFTHEAGEM